MLRGVLACALAAVLGGCGSLLDLLDLRRDLQELENSFGVLGGSTHSASCEACPTIIVALGETDGEQVLTYRVLERPGPFELAVPGGTRHLFAFNDRNNDFVHQPDEPSARLTLPADFGPGRSVRALTLTLEPRPGGPAPQLANLFDLRGMVLGSLDVALGSVMPLDDTRFDHSQAWLAMWQPLQFMKAGYAGIYFLQPYDADKTPVLFIHGIAGSPRDFTALIGDLDRERFQPWVLYYPTGIDLDAIADGLLGMLTALHHRHGFERLHVVAHSMGGLVARAFINDCARAVQCAYLRTLVTLSTPFGGHPYAQEGVDRSPVVMPMWRSIAPGSPFLSSLFDQPLPHPVRHHLLFGFHKPERGSGPSGDGTISLSSQLPPTAQDQATSVRGFDEDHLSILLADDATGHVNTLLRAE